MAEFVGTLAGMVKLVAASAVVGVLFGVIDVAKLKAVAVKSDLAGPVAAYPWLISQARRLGTRRKLTIVGIVSHGHDGGDGDGDDGAKDDGGVDVGHRERI
jgi:hypothetical protein